MQTNYDKLSIIEKSIVWLIAHIFICAQVSGAFFCFLWVKSGAYRITSLHFFCNIRENVKVSLYRIKKAKFGKRDFRNKKLSV